MFVRIAGFPFAKLRLSYRHILQFVQDETAPFATFC